MTDARGTRELLYETHDAAPRPVHDDDATGDPGRPDIEPTSKRARAPLDHPLRCVHVLSSGTPRERRCAGRGVVLRGGGWTCARHCRHRAPRPPATGEPPVEQPPVCPLCQHAVTPAPSSVGARPVLLAPCGHAMHASCARRWFSTSSTCPVCRDAPVGPSSIPAAPGRSRTSAPTTEDAVYLWATARLAEAVDDLDRSLRA